mmetsp:Transcript_63388/g.131420  ORF Transcript_63388/g.131420 Transcript_63388/m.131420 type:complete len:267 (-) Transcript_63388:200-1000(-)
MNLDRCTWARPCYRASLLLFDNSTRSAQTVPSTEVVAGQVETSFVAGDFPAAVLHQPSYFASHEVRHLLSRRSCIQIRLVRSQGEQMQLHWLQPPCMMGPAVEAKARDDVAFLSQSSLAIRENHLLALGWMERHCQLLELLQHIIRCKSQAFICSHQCKNACKDVLWEPAQMQGHAVPGNCAHVQKILLVVTTNFRSLQASRLLCSVLDAIEAALTFPNMSQVLALLRHEQADALELSLSLPEEFQVKSFCVCSAGQADNSIWHCP